MLKSGKLPKVTRGHIVVDVPRICVIGQVDGIEPDTELAIFHPANRYEGKMKLAVYLYVQREERREASTVGLANIVLERIHVRIGKSGMQVNDRAEGQLPGQLKNARTHQPVGNIRFQGSADIGTDHRLLERYERARQRVQVASGSAPNIRDPQFASFGGSQADGRFKLPVVRAACIAESEDRVVGNWIEKRINQEEVPRLALNVAQPQHHAPRQLALHAHIPGEVARTGAEIARGAGPRCSQVDILESDGCSTHRTCLVKEADHSQRVLSEGRTQHGGAVVEQAGPRAKDGLLA